MQPACWRPNQLPFASNGSTWWRKVEHQRSEIPRFGAVWAWGPVWLIRGGIKSHSNPKSTIFSVVSSLNSPFYFLSNSPADFAQANVNAKKHIGAFFWFVYSQLSPEKSCRENLEPRVAARARCCRIARFLSAYQKSPVLSYITESNTNQARAC